ncbi:YcxB family protein [Micromonospora sp. 4G57]|uniref:YcxB family protein n=1 Tax=Micromonospora sicca TaxID=2202420 RepID=A0ABU5JDK4_9ACTN|nr:MULTISPECIES: YcxB family protein [unclassified Micromonospora]MDZ5442574.1 YcxB family protein [Micromonospora sp. 4G57]MDZ5490674.1 YcxB family protein [Micromonospora sp. 4G53]
MEIEFTHQRDRGYARRLVAASTVRSGATHFVTGLVTAAAGVAALTAEPAWTYLCGCLGLGVGIGWMLKVLLLPGQAVRRLPAAWFQPRSYRFDDDGVAWSSAYARSCVSWAAFGRVTVRPFAYLLWQPGNLAVWDVPRGSLTPEQDRQLAALFAAHIPAAPTRPTAPVEPSGEQGPQAPDRVRPPTP